MSRFLFLVVLTFCVSSALAGAVAPVSSAPAAAASQAATAPGAVEYLQLVNALADDAARLINAIFRQATPRSQAAGRDIATFDYRTNTVVLKGAPELVARAVDLLQKIEQIDVVRSPFAFFFYHPTRARATDLAAAMNQLLRRPGATPATSAGGATTTTAASQLAAGSFGVEGNVAYFVANPDTNSVLVTTDTQFEEMVRGLLKVIDREAAASAPAAQSRPALP